MAERTHGRLATSLLDEITTLASSHGTRVGVVTLRVTPPPLGTLDTKGLIEHVREGVRESDSVLLARRAGLTVLFSDANGIDDVVVVADRVRADLVQWWNAHHGDRPITVSAGAAVVADHENAVESVARAERALGQAHRPVVGARGRTVSAGPRERSAGPGADDAGPAVAEADQDDATIG